MARRLGQLGWILVLAVVASPVWFAPSASAATTIGLSRTSGSPGNTVTVSGDGWVANKPVELWLDASHSSYPLTDTSLPSATAGDAGELHATFVIPAQAIGSFEVRACQSCDGDDARSGLTVVPSLRLGSTQVTVNQRVGVSGTGWPFQAGDVYLFADPADSTDLTKALAHAPPNESWELATHVRVPALPSGRHEIFACQASACAGGAGQTRALQLSAAGPRFDLTARAAYVIVVPHASRPPTLSLTPSAGVATTVIHATGSGWVAGAGPVWIFAGRQAVSSTANALGSKTPDRNGAVSVSFSAPALVPGRHVFYACQVCTGKKARLAPHVFVAVAAPTLDLDPSSATAGSTVQVRGSNWQVGGGDVSVFADPSLRFDPSAALLTIRPNVDGTFASSLVLPALGTGVHELFACQSCADAGYLRASRSFTITASARTVPPLLVGLAAATVATAGLALWWLRRIRRPKPPAPREPPPAAPAPPGPPQFRLRADDNLGVGVRSPDGPTRPTLRLIPHPDVSPDAERVEVLT